MVVAALVGALLAAVAVVLLLTVPSNEPTRARAAARSTATPVDSAGCPRQDGSERPPGGVSPSAPIVGNAPDGGRLCAYDRATLVGSHALSAAEAVELADAVRAGERGFGPEGRGCPGGYDYTGAGLEPHFTAHLTYPAEGPTDVWVFGNVCLPSGVTNSLGGARRLGPDLPSLLARLVRTPTPFPVTDASLPPGPVATGPMTVGECPDGVRTSRSRAHETARNAMLRLAAPMFASHPGARWAYAGIQDGIDEQAVVTADGSRVARFVANRLPGHRWLSVTVAETC